MQKTKQPKFMKDFLVYLTTIKGKSQRTRKEYEYDLTLFFSLLQSCPGGFGYREFIHH
ncbi:hypothetical protein [Lysinibacillus boronitolerans]|uniref:hypothetical protein n=1 Tax=Lysinibacillus boronitolerans TaxID=309788 RepID=UPI00031CDA2E|nr:hypothetical protein [Lysinibacillus boronitolerans]